MVLFSPYTSLVPIISGLFIGGAQRPRLAVYLKSEIIGSEHHFLNPSKSAIGEKKGYVFQD